MFACLPESLYHHFDRCRYVYFSTPRLSKIDKRSPEYNDAKNTAQASVLLKGIMRRMKQEDLQGGV